MKTKYVTTLLVNILRNKTIHVVCYAESDIHKQTIVCSKNRVIEKIVYTKKRLILKRYMLQEIELIKLSDAIWE